MSSDNTSVSIMLDNSLARVLILRLVSDFLIATAVLANEMIGCEEELGTWGIGGAEEWIEDSVGINLFMSWFSLSMAWEWTQIERKRKSGVLYKY